MWRDVVGLRDFYATPLGQAARRTIRRALVQAWPDATGLRVLGIGFPTPYLPALADKAERAMAVMPAAQGVLAWPNDGPCRVVLADEEELPFPDRSVDRVVLVHALEFSPQPERLLHEVWRMLSDGGRILIVVPNRTGWWSVSEATPFGHGRPYTSSQITMLLRETMFSRERDRGALWFPPLENRLTLSWAPAIEQIGGRWADRLSGVRVIEAVKQYYVQPLRRAARSREVPVLNGLGKPAINGPMGRS